MPFPGEQPARYTRSFFLDDHPWPSVFMNIPWLDSGHCRLNKRIEVAGPTSGPVSDEFHIDEKYTSRPLFELGDKVARCVY